MTNQTWSPSKACADFVADLQYADIPAAVIDTMKRDTLDWIGCLSAVLQIALPNRSKP